MILASIYDRLFFIKMTRKMIYCFKRYSDNSKKLYRKRTEDVYKVMTMMGGNEGSVDLLF